VAFVFYLAYNGYAQNYRDIGNLQRILLLGEFRSTTCFREGQVLARGLLLAIANVLQLCILALYCQALGTP